MKRVIAALAILAATMGLPMMASALTFSPPSFDYASDPGKTVSGELKLVNDESTAQTLRFETLNFQGRAGDETTGLPEFYPANEVRDGRGLAPWISFAKPEATLQPGEKGSVTFQIKVPADASPGSYFGALVVSSKSGQGAQGVGLVGNTAILVMLRVNGTVVESLRLTSFKAIPPVSGSLPVTLEARVQNDGTVHMRPFGEVTIRNVFGKKVGVVAMNRKEYKTVLPGSARVLDTVWQRANLPADAFFISRQLRNFAFGPYTAELALQYGTEGKVLVASSTFWVISWLPVALGLAVLFAAVLGIRALLGWHRRRIIEAYENEHHG